MKQIFFCLLVLVTPHFGNAQISFESFESSLIVSKIYVTNDKIVAVDGATLRLIEIDKLTKSVIRKIDWSDGFKLINSHSLYKVDHYIIGVNKDHYCQRDGMVVYDINNGNYWFDSLDLSIYSGLVSYCLFNSKSCADDSAIYCALNQGTLTDLCLLRYHPIQGFDTIQLINFPFNAGENIRQMAKNDSVFCVYTNQNRFILWNENLPSSYHIINEPKPLIKSLIAYNENFLYIGNQSDKDSIFSIRTDYNRYNISAEQNIYPNQGIAYIEMFGDSIFIYKDNGLYILDTGTNQAKLISAQYYDIPGKPRSCFLENDSILYFSCDNFLPNECRTSLFSINKTDEIDSFQTNIGSYMPYVDQHGYWINKNNDFVFLDMDHFVIYNQNKNFVNYLMNDPYLATGFVQNIYNNNFFYANLEFEDTVGNLYGKLIFDYDWWSSTLTDTTFYIVITPNYDHHLITKSQYILLTNRVETVVNSTHYFIEGDNLKSLNNSNIVTYGGPGSEPITHVFSSHEKIYCSSFSNVYRFFPESGTFKLLYDLIPIGSYEISEFTSDALGNVYFRQLYDLYRINYKTDSVDKIIYPPEIPQPYNNYLFHDKYGNIYPQTISFSATQPSPYYFYNGFKWVLGSNIIPELPFQPGIYEQKVSPYSTRILLDFILSKIEVTCACEPLYEINSNYSIYDTTDAIALTINPSRTNVLWNDGDTSFIKSFNYPGQYWVKVANEFGCTAFKSFSIGLNPTSNFQNKDIFYYVKQNIFPLIFMPEMFGFNVQIYDLKGALVKNLENYQNDWTPTDDYAGAIMVYVVFNNSGEFLQRGRIIFL